MNLTVGPLPPAVYWRRRAIVVGGLLVVILLIVYACTGNSSKNSDGQRPTALAQSQSPSPSPSGLDAYPIASSSASMSELPDPGVSASATDTAAPGSIGGVPICADTDIKVVATIESTSSNTKVLQYGGTFLVKLKIQNVSSHACARDVGSAPEGLQISQDGAKIWSSDDCNIDHAAKAHDVRTFQPNIMIYAQVDWNSYLNTSDSCTKGTAAAPRGTYELAGHVGTATSDSTTFTIS